MDKNYVIIVESRKLKKHIYKNPQAQEKPEEIVMETPLPSNNLLDSKNDLLEEAEYSEATEQPEFKDALQSNPKISAAQKRREDKAKKKAEKLAKKAEKAEQKKKKKEKKAAAVKAKKEKSEKPGRKQKTIKINKEANAVSQEENKKNIKKKFEKSGKTRKITFFEAVPTQKTLEEVIKEAVNDDGYYSVIKPLEDTNKSRKPKKQRDKRQIAIIAALVCAAIGSLVVLIVTLGGIF